MVRSSEYISVEQNTLDFEKCELFEQLNSLKDSLQVSSEEMCKHNFLLKCKPRELNMGQKAFWF